LRIVNFKLRIENSARKRTTGILFVNHKRRLWSWLLVLALVGGALGCALWLDPFVRSWVLEHQNRSAEVFMRNVSRFGDWPEHVALGLFLTGVAWWRGNKKWTRVFLSMLIACAIAGAAARVIKVTTGRARPSVKTEEVWNGPRLSEKFHAFPSGHMAASTAFWAVLLFANWRIGLACLSIPLLIGASRMYVAAHYLSDVVVAGMLGILVAYLVARFMLRQIRNPQSAIRI
jgi:membrane-associated phospholipid phosphatase